MMKASMKKIYLLPNLVTTGNLFCGFYSVIASVQQNFVIAAWFIVLAAVFDLLDGRIARLAKATSPFGVQYDSLSDLISFGVAPSVLAYLWGLSGFGRIGWLVAFLFLACSAFRLARFNVYIEENIKVDDKDYFLGLPSPAAANVFSTFVIFQNEMGWPGPNALQVVTLIGIFILGVLMGTRLPFPSFKELNWKSKASFSYLLIAVLLIMFVLIRPQITLFCVLFGYVGTSLAWVIFRKQKRFWMRKKQLWMHSHPQATKEE